MTKLAILIILIFTSLPLSDAAKDRFVQRVVNSKIGSEIKIGNDSKESKTKADETLPDFVLAPLPYKKSNYTDFSPSAKAVKSVDLATNKTLFEKNSSDKLEIASLTKLMTAILAIENLKPDEIITVPPLQTQPDGEVMGLTTEEEIKAGELIHAVLIYSAGDATQALATHIGGSESKFAEMMNDRAKKMGLTNTHFTNAIGLDDQNNYSTATDLINLTRIFLGNDYLKNVVSKKTYIARDEAGKTYSLNNTNQLLDDIKVFGVKTGYTIAAGQCLVTLAKENNHEILTIVLGSPNRFEETNNLINWVYENWGW